MQKETNKEFFLILEKFAPKSYFNCYYRGLKFIYTSKNIVIFRYPYQYDTDEYVIKFVEFIVYNFSNYSFDISGFTNTYYIEIDYNNRIGFVDSTTFKHNECTYIKQIDPEFFKRKFFPRQI